MIFISYPIYQVIQALSSQNKASWCTSSILFDVGMEVAAFQEVSFRHIRREHNKAAVFMASKGHFYNSPTLFFPPMMLIFWLDPAVGI